MLSDITMFGSITILKCKGNTTPVVKLGDDNIMLQIKGYGYIDYIIMGKGVRPMGYYVHNLGTALISVGKCIKYKGYYFNA